MRRVADRARRGAALTQARSTRARARGPARTSSTQPLADAPQLQNAGIWQAPPILVSGASAYRDGEFLYQDFLYDDNGASGSPVQNDPRFSGNAFSRPTGTYTYPTNAVYANNAADLVELRVKPLADATAFRITLNTLKDAEPRRHDDRDRRTSGSAAAVPARRQRHRRRPSCS